ncbi:hypothetical protein BH23GEM8_BH23GEM8_05910 [soil metagenome]
MTSPGSDHELACRTTPRNVIRMAGMYLVLAWLVVQVAATLVPTGRTLLLK